MPPTAPSARAAVFGDTGDTGDEFGEYDEYGEDEYDEDEYDEYDEYGESPGCDEGPAPVSPLADGRHLVLLRGVDVEAATVELTEFGLVEGPLHVMHVSAGLDLTGLVGLPPPSSFTATVEGGLVTLLEPF